MKFEIIKEIPIKELIKEENEEKYQILFDECFKEQIFIQMIKEFVENDFYKNDELIDDFWYTIYNQLCNKNYIIFNELLTKYFNQYELYVDHFKKFIFMGVKNFSGSIKTQFELLIQLYNIDIKIYDKNKFCILNDYCVYIELGGYNYPNFVDCHIYIDKLMKHNKVYYDFLGNTVNYDKLNILSDESKLTVLLEYVKSINKVIENLWEIDLLITLMKYFSPIYTFSSNKYKIFILEIFNTLVELLDTSMPITDIIYEKFEEEFTKIDFKYDSLDEIKENEIKRIKLEVEHIDTMTKQFPNYNHN